MVRGTEPIEDDELLYRRVPKYFAPDGNPSPKAFRPRRRDETGLSLLREKYVRLREAAVGEPGQTYYVAVLKAGDLRANGMEVVPKPSDDCPGHAEIPSLRYANQREDRQEELQVILA